MLSDLRKRAEKFDDWASKVQTLLKKMDTNDENGWFVTHLIVSLDLQDLNYSNRREVNPFSQRIEITSERRNYEQISDKF